MDLYGIIGKPLGKSLSRDFFTRKFADEGIDAAYQPFELDRIEEIETVLNTHPNLRGFNVTIPYKEQIIPYLASVSPQAAAVKAVNVVKVSRTADGGCSLQGHNSDIIGFTDSIRPLLQPHHTHALVLGTGGAAKAVDYSLRQMGIECRYVSRHGGEGRLTYSQLTDEVMQHNKLIVNCTPLGMYPVDQCPDIPYTLLTPRHLLYDVIYHPAETLFMQRGAQQGAQVVNGYEMWRLQALASWQIWNS